MQKYFDFITSDVAAAGVVLSGGGGRATFGSCGIFSGGLMALSARFSPHSETPSEQEMADYNNARSKFNEFRDWFIAEFGGVTCRDVQLKLYGRFFNFMDDKERLAFREFQEAHGRKCNQATVKGALKAAEILSPEVKG